MVRKGNATIFLIIMIIRVAMILFVMANLSSSMSSVENDSSLGWLSPSNIVNSKQCSVSEL